VPERRVHDGVVRLLPDKHVWITRRLARQIARDEKDWRARRLLVLVHPAQEAQRDEEDIETLLLLPLTIPFVERAEPFLELKRFQVGLEIPRSHTHFALMLPEHGRNVEEAVPAHANPLGVREGEPCT